MVSMVGKHTKNALLIEIFCFCFVGKKLKCLYCDRLYGYETNLRAHIRQRHQGIRVPCPFCSRTFTRNNTVRRHIAREHKAEIGISANATIAPAAAVAAAAAAAANHSQ